MPQRSMSFFDVAADIISIAQQARPDSSGHRLFIRIRSRTRSALVGMTSSAPQRASSRRTRSECSSRARWVCSVGSPPPYASGLGRGPQRVGDDDGLRQVPRLGGDEGRPRAGSSEAPGRVGGPGRRCRPRRRQVVARQRHVRTPLRHAYARPSRRMPTNTSMLTNRSAGSRLGSPEDQRPQEDEHDLDVERHEQQRVDVERDPEPGVGVAVRVDARLVRVALVLVALVRCEISHASPIVRKTNETPAKANPTTYQIGSRGPRCRAGRVRRRAALEVMTLGVSVRAPRAARHRHSSSGPVLRSGGPVGRPARPIAARSAEAPSAAVGRAAGAGRAAPCRRAAPRPKPGPGSRPCRAGRAAGRGRTAGAARPRASRRAGAAIGAARSPPAPRAARPGSSRRPGSRPARAAAARTAARSTVAVRSWRPTWRNGSPPTRVAGERRAGCRRPPRARAGPRARRRSRRARRPRGEVRGRARQPVVDGEADLGDLAVGELDALGAEARGQLRRRGLGLDPREPALGVDAHEQLADAAAAGRRRDGPAARRGPRSRRRRPARVRGRRGRRPPRGDRPRPAAASRARSAARRASSTSTGR